MTGQTRQCSAGIFRVMKTGIEWMPVHDCGVVSVIVKSSPLHSCAQFFGDKNSPSGVWHNATRRDSNARVQNSRRQQSPNAFRSLRRTGVTRYELVHARHCKEIVYWRPVDAVAISPPSYLQIGTPHTETRCTRRHCHAHTHTSAIQQHSGKCTSVEEQVNTFRLGRP